MPKKFYAVCKGRQTGIYTDWAACKAQIDGFAGAIYKGFATQKDAEDFLHKYGNDPKERGEVCKKALNPSPCCTEDVPHPKPLCAIAYVDGSYKQSAAKFSYGVVFFASDAYGKTSETHFSKAFSNEELLEMRNVSGEIMGAAMAMKTAKEMGLNEITIYHDYEGIAKWCLGQWKANKPWTQKYKSFYDNISKEIKINFIKVKGHSNDKYNDLADQLAKDALDINIK